MERWIALARQDEVPDGTVRRFRVDFRSAWLVRRGEVLKAYYDLCTHAGGQLAARGDAFTCQRHGATFDVATGTPRSGPAVDGEPLKQVDLEVRDGMIYFKRVTNDE